METKHIDTFCIFVVSKMSYVSTSVFGGAIFDDFVKVINLVPLILLNNFKTEKMTLRRISLSVIWRSYYNRLKIVSKKYNYFKKH